MKRYFNGIQPHINIEKVEAEIAFLPGPPERAFEIAKKFSSYEKVTEQREFVTYKGKHGGRECDTGCCWCCGIYQSGQVLIIDYEGKKQEELKYNLYTEIFLDEFNHFNSKYRTNYYYN